MSLNSLRLTDPQYAWVLRPVEVDEVRHKHISCSSVSNREQSMSLLKVFSLIYLYGVHTCMVVIVYFMYYLQIAVAGSAVSKRKRPQKSECITVHRFESIYIYI